MVVNQRKFNTAKQFIDALMETTGGLINLDEMYIKDVEKVPYDEPRREL